MELQQSSPAEMFDRYFGAALFIPWAKVLLEQAAPEAGEAVLDLACGTGTVARHAAPRVREKGRVVGLDLNDNMLEIARERPVPDGLTIEWQVGDACALDLPDKAFDLVLCQQGIQFFSDRAAAAREMRRVLKPGGRLALNVWQALDRHPVFEALCTAEAHHLGVPLAEVSAPWSYPDGEELRSLLSEAGFQQVEVVPTSLDVHLPSPERFVSLSLFAATAFMPGVDWEDEAVRSTLIQNVQEDIAPVLERYRSGDALTFPTRWNTAVAYVE